MLGASERISGKAYRRKWPNALVTPGLDALSPGARQKVSQFGPSRGQPLEAMPDSVYYLNPAGEMPSPFTVSKNALSLSGSVIVRSTFVSTFVTALLPVPVVLV